MGNVSGWTEGILLTLAFIAIVAVVVGAMNAMYDKDYDLGISDSSNSTTLFIEYQDTAEQQIQGGDVEFNADTGITLKSSYGITKDVISIVWSFLTGGFIESVAQAWNVGEAGLVFAQIIRIIWFLSLVFALLYALFKVSL